MHRHCHQKAVLTTDGDDALLDKLGLHYDVLDSGCCGMAGSFGFARATADVSVAVGEQVLLPAVRAAPADCLVIADGYSCREQIAQCTPRRAVHLAEVLARALAGDARQATARNDAQRASGNVATRRYGAR